MSERGGTRPGGAGRVVAGSARGLRLQAPPNGARPLGDRLKEAVFAVLEPELRRRAFLDLFAGSGAGAIEALSRGAGRAVLVENDGRAIATIGTNLATTRLAELAVVRRADAIEWLRTSAAGDGPFDVILLDPPYDAPKHLISALGMIAAAGPGAILTGSGVLVAKHGRRTSLDPRIGLLASVAERRFGESAVTFLRWRPDDQEAR